MPPFLLRGALVLTVLSSLLTTANAQSIRLDWSEDGNRFLYRLLTPAGAKTFFLGNTSERTCTPAFDPAKVADGLSKQLDKAVDPSTLPIDRVLFSDSQDHLLLLGDGKSWQLDLTTQAITPATQEAIDSQSRRLFLPPRRSGGSSESTHIAVENRLDDPLEFFWIGTDGSEQNYGTIPPGATYRQHTYVGHVWLLKSDDEPLGCFSARAEDWIVIHEDAVRNVEHRDHEARDRRPRRNADRRSQTSPDSEWTAVVRDHNLWLENKGEEVQLTTNGSPDNSFGERSPDVHWSADSQYLVALQTKKSPERMVHLIESSPDDQLQPKLVSYRYRKPGDDLPLPTVHIFSRSDGREISLANDLFDNPWSLRFHGWAAGNRFYLYYNQRGHQTVRVLEVAADTGEVRTVIEETSPTFIQYSDAGKSVFEFLDEEEILWASERSGWNHLYRYAASSGKVRNAVTAGEWNVKRIQKIDRDAGRIWFYAVGVHPRQDPYHEHFCRVNFDGSDFQVLTDGDGTHRVRFEQDGRYFVDTYSRVDLAPVTELRDSETGELVCELERQDTSQRFTGRRLTERFVAKGRDGKTDIWGIIHWPADFDPDKTYPVVENIYAGPHDHHVPKAFRTRYRHQHQIADAGMIVVQIDGMGTAWRSKEFHDVCHKNLRDAGFPDRIAWMKAAAEKYPQMDLTRVGIYGGSAGGQNAMAALLWHHDFYDVAVADCGCHDNRMDKIWWNEQWMGWPVDESYRENSNMANAHLLEGNLMLLVGELDRNVDPATTAQVVRQLIRHDKDFEFVLVAGAGHGSAETPWASRKRLNFLKQHLSKEEPEDR